MNRWTPATAEFEERQLCLDFGTVARAVLSIVVDTKKRLLSSWWRSQRPKMTRPALVLEQMTFFFLKPA